MPEPEFTLGPEDRKLVARSIVAAYAFRAWHLFGLHVRTNHVHAVVQTTAPAERALSYLKARATLALKERHPQRQRFWTKHGSNRYLWNHKSLNAALDYVIHQQGTRMEWWLDDTAHPTHSAHSEP